MDYRKTKLLQTFSNENIGRAVRVIKSFRKKTSTEAFPQLLQTKSTNREKQNTTNYSFHDGYNTHCGTFLLRKKKQD